jgi:hypothetical protein
MADPQFHLAQVNIARAAAPLDDPVMAGFMSQLDALNAVADASPGFVWRLQDASGNATSVRPYPDDDRVLFNLSVWESLEALTAYVYRSGHGGILRRRREWFVPFEGPFQALWWVPAGTRPSVAEARERLEHLQAHGPSERAFTFRQPFTPDGQPTRPPGVPLDDLLNTPRPD